MTRSGRPRRSSWRGSGWVSLGCAFFVRRSNERATLWLLPMLVAAVLWAFPWAGPHWLWPLLGVAGFLLGAAMPVLVSYGQQLLARRPAHRQFPHHGSHVGHRRHARGRDDGRLQPHCSDRVRDPIPSPPAACSRACSAPGSPTSILDEVSDSGAGRRIRGG